MVFESRLSPRNHIKPRNLRGCSIVVVRYPLTHKDITFGSSPDALASSSSSSTMCHSHWEVYDCGGARREIARLWCTEPTRNEPWHEHTRSNEPVAKCKDCSNCVYEGTLIEQERRRTMNAFMTKEVEQQRAKPYFMDSTKKQIPPQYLPRSPVREVIPAPIYPLPFNYSPISSPSSGQSCPSQKLVLEPPHSQTPSSQRASSNQREAQRHNLYSRRHQQPRPYPYCEY